MKKFYFFIPFFFLSIIFFSYGCNPSAGGFYAPSVIKGRVLDSATHRSLGGVTIISIPSSNGAMSDTGGYYILTNIPMSSSATNVWVIASRNMYLNDTTKVWLPSNDTLEVNILMLPESGVYVQNNIIVRQAENNSSYSCLDLEYLRAVPTAGYRDVDLRDSASTFTRFQFRSSSLFISYPGFITLFGNSLGNFTKSEFDTLARYYDAGDSLSVSNFPRDRTDYFYTPLTEHSVVPFYLLGRYNQHLSSFPIYGLLYIKDSYIESGTNLFSVVVDIKINKNGQNYFVPTYYY